MAGNEARLDHVILLVPYRDLIDPPQWLVENFTVSPGGKHADDKTENRLVLFRDGTYLEIIAFIEDDPQRRSGHWWDKPFGVVDFALTVFEPLDHEGLDRRLKESGTGVSYAKPKEGGRRTPDGKELQWRVTFPQGVERGNVPFWCEDITPRDRRVPITEANTTHPSGALGMAGVLVEVDKENVGRISTATAAILDLSRQANDRYEVGVPEKVSTAKKPSIRLGEIEASDRDLSLTLILQTADHSGRHKIRQKIGDGIVSIDFE